MKRAFLVLLLPLGGVSYTTPASSEALSQYCQNVYVEYSNAPGPKAFVTGGDGSCWWWHGTKTLAQSQKNALNACTKSGAQNCKLRESEL